MLKHVDHFHGSDLEKIEQVYGIKKEEIISFSANVNPLGISPVMRSALIERIDCITSYPDREYTSLRQQIGSYTGAPLEHIVVGNGSTELISLFIQLEHPKKALILGPTYSEYEREISLGGGTSLYYPLKEENGFLADITDFQKHLGESLDLLVICNPNNPTGLLTGRQLLLEILEKAKTQKTYVCIDECFLDFVREKEAYTITGALAAFPNLLILKSFTKLYAMPGLRLGYILSQNQALLERIRKAGQPWSVSEPAQQAGIAALTETDFRERTLTLVEAERERLETALTKLGLDVWPGKANYLCFRAPGETALYEKLLEKGILIRRCQNYNGLTKEDYRIAVRTPEENSRLIQAINEVFTNEKA